MKSTHMILPESLPEARRLIRELREDLVVTRAFLEDAHKATARLYRLLRKHGICPGCGEVGKCECVWLASESDCPYQAGVQ